MAFNYNGVSPTSIKYGSTELTVLKYGTTAVWGKPYSLSISAGANTTVTVNRTSSPNQNASTGNLSSGSVIYYGDVLTITANASSGYVLSTFTVNGSNWVSGNTITVTNSVSVITGNASQPQWRTVWTGEKNYTGNSSFTELVGNYPTRVTGKIVDLYMLGWTPVSDEKTFASVELPTTQTANTAKVTMTLNSSTPAISLEVSYSGMNGGGVYLTQVEQYY